MVLQDFTDDWTEHDPDGEATVTQTKVAISDCNFDKDCYVYKDYGADFFNGDITNQFELTVKQGEDTYFVLWAISNGNTGHNGMANEDTMIMVDPPSAAGDYKLLLKDKANSISDASCDLDFNTKYYITIARAIKTFTCTIRTGSHSGPVVDTITITEDVLSSRRYLYMVAEYG